MKKQLKILDLVKPFNSERFDKAWQMLLTENKHWRKKSDRQLQLALADLSKYSEDDAIEAIKTAIIGNYMGLFPKHSKPKSNQSAISSQAAEVNQLLGI